MWNNLEKATHCLSLLDFKSRLKSDLKPKKIEHYCKGSKVGNILPLLKASSIQENLEKRNVLTNEFDFYVCYITIISEVLIS